MAHSNDDKTSIAERRKYIDSLSTKVILISLVTIAILLIANFAASFSLDHEKRIMAPGPIGSTDSIAKPLV